LLAIATSSRDPLEVESGKLKFYPAHESGNITLVFLPGLASLHFSPNFRPYRATPSFHDVFVFFF
jgi:hypothetical protein